MEKQKSTSLPVRMRQAFSQPQFLQKLQMSKRDRDVYLVQADWVRILEPIMPVRQRLVCREVLEMLKPLLCHVAPEPESGWPLCAYQTAVSLLYPHLTPTQYTPAQRDGALCVLQYLQVLFDIERQEVEFDPFIDFRFCTDLELSQSLAASPYRRFMRRFREEYIYEMLRLGREVTPFHTLEHIAGVHHIAMMISRTFQRNGGPIDLALISGAAAGHDFGKFGCKPGERVPYLHYYYTEQWFTRRELPSIGRIASNHSVWDLEIENLSAESLALVYADFRMKQYRDESGQEVACLYSLQEAFDVILNKLDNVDDAKRQRYTFVYTKLRDFEEYLVSYGVDTTLQTEGETLPRQTNPSLMTSDQVVKALRRTAVDHNIQLMCRLSRERLFVETLESARSEKDPIKIRAYVSTFEEYFTYWSQRQKEQTLDFLYELLMMPDGDIRRQAAVLIGRILAEFVSGYKKERPVGIAPDHQEERAFELWAEYLNKLIHPDSRLTPRQMSMIRYQAKTVADALLGYASPQNQEHFARELMRHYEHPENIEPDAAFVLMDAVQNLALERVPCKEREWMLHFAIWWLDKGNLPQKAAAMRLLQQLADTWDAAEQKLICHKAEREEMRQVVARVQCEENTPLLFLKFMLGRKLGMDVSDLQIILNQSERMSSVFLDNLKTATPWILKAVGVQYLQHQAVQDVNGLHIATHFSNLMKVSENVVVRRMAGEGLLYLTETLSPDRRNDIAVELSKALETGQTELSKYIPEYLGRFALWITPRELDELLAQMQALLSFSNTGVVAAALSTVGAMLEHYTEYKKRFGESEQVWTARRQFMAGMILKGLASYRESVRQEALHVLGQLFSSEILTVEDKASLFTLVAKKFLFLIQEQEEKELTFFYTSAALRHIYSFIVYHRIERGRFQFREPEKVAFFPGTFDPFSLAHKGIVQAIRDKGFEVYLAIDEFSWSKKTQASLARRLIVSISVADEFDVYVYPHDLPVNLSTPEDLRLLREIFSGRELYLAVGSDVIANASAYRAEPVSDSVHSLNHIIFHRNSDGKALKALSADLTDRITGKIMQLHLPAQLEDISSTRIRDNIDLDRDISNLIDPTVQDYIYSHSLYLREPQYKRIIRAGSLEFVWAESPEQELWDEAASLCTNHPQKFNKAQDTLLLLQVHHQNGKVQTAGWLTMRMINSSALYDTLGSQEYANIIRTHTSGRILLISGVGCGEGEKFDVEQLLITEALSQALRQDCCYAVWWSYGITQERYIELLERQGFIRLDTDGAKPLLLVDMRSPVVLLQNIPTTLKEPFASHRRVLQAIKRAHYRLQHAICQLYPGTLVLSLNAEIIYHRLVQMLTVCNGVPAEPVEPRVLGPKMCVPFGKILRGSAVPNTVTKTLHTDKIFQSDLRSHTIAAFPGYAPLESQIRTIQSFRRPVMLVDDLIHTATRLRILNPIFKQENVEVDRVIVGLLSGRGRDLVEEIGRKVESVYFVPDLKAWFVESTMYPFIGGDTVQNARASVPGLTPGINLILPYAFPRFYKTCDRKAVFAFSQTCLENSKDIMESLERIYREQYARNLTISRLSEAVILPLSPDKGSSLKYDGNLSASACLRQDIQQLFRMKDLLE